MPLYEYRCEACQAQFEVVQSVNARAEDTTCPHCREKKASRLMSMFASKVVGDHKPGFSEMKAYNMLNERMDKLGKLPPLSGKRTMPAPNVSSDPGSGASSNS